MAKTFKIASIFCIILAFLFILSACSLGTYSVAFIDYNGKLVGTRTYSNNEAVNNTPIPSTRIGYTFKGWNKNITPPENIESFTEKVDYNMYAEYQINPNAPTFAQSGHSLLWYNSQINSTPITFTANQPQYILIQDKISYANISKIEVNGTENSEFACLSFKLFDENGYIAVGKSIFTNQWEPTSSTFPTLGEYSFVLEVTSAYNGEATITVS